MEEMNVMGLPTTPNTERLKQYLDDLDETTRALMIAADDAYDALYGHLIEKEFGVHVECNPDGDRSKIAIDGEILDAEGFNEWLTNAQRKKAEEAAERRQIDLSNRLSAKINRWHQQYPADTMSLLPLAVPFLCEPQNLSEEETELYLRTFVRAMSGRCLGKGMPFTWEINRTNGEYRVRQLYYGRPMNATEKALADVRLNDIVEAFSR